MAYRGLARAALRSLVAYQGAFLFGLLASVFSALAMLYLWRAVLASSPAAHGFDWPHMRAYLLAAFVAGSLASSWVDYRLAFRIQRGDVGLDLVRPVDYQRARFAEAVGFGAYELGTGLVVAGVAALAFGGVPAPPLGSLPLLLLSALLVLPLRFGLVYASAMAVFWTQNYVGVQAGRLALVSLFSGALVPLAFLPDWLRLLAAVLPFAGMASTPALLFSGQLQGAEAGAAVAVQAAWTVGLWYGTRGLWRAASRQLTVHGG
ncbi:ABC-2 type transport system permease protein [Motilibacter rhizosphaerae]|uniref:ABC-2 type transport system permease protein n=1 Tax=Motilibacter rhizosphaerae TaxID=598652 RepID=A0A4Q7NGD4_9ACTN|nr:ABC-2 type transport system permease protein [Motilibacter rhizosphaerae]